MTLMFVAESDEWRYLRAHDVVLLVDGKTIDPSETHNGEVIRAGQLLEQVLATFSDAQTAQLRRAMRIEIRIGRLEVEIGGKALASLRALLQG